MVGVVPVELPGKFSPQEHPKKDGKPSYILKYIKRKAHLTNSSVSRQQCKFVKRRKGQLFIF